MIVSSIPVIWGPLEDGSKIKALDVLGWLSAMLSHVPNNGVRMARYNAMFQQRSARKTL